MPKTHGCDAMSIHDAAGDCVHRSSLERRLGASGYLALRRIDCDCQGGVLSLRGCVPSHYLRQVAQAIAAEVAGVRRVDNQIRVLPADARRN